MDRSACDDERTDLARLNQPPDASAAGNASGTGGGSRLGPMVIEVNANPDLNAIASLMPAAGVYEHVTGGDGPIASQMGLRPRPAARAPCRGARDRSTDIRRVQYQTLN